LRLLVQGLVSVGLVVFLIARADKPELADRLRSLHWLGAVGIFVLFSIDRFVMAYKWRLLLEVKGVDAPFLEVVKVYYLSTFVGLFLPATVGSDLVRGAKLFRDGHGGTAVASSILMERMLGFVAAATAALACSTGLWLVLGLEIAPLFWFTAAVFAATVIVFAASLFLPRLERLAGRHAIFATAERLYASYSSYRDHRGVLVIFFLLCVAEQLFPVVVHYVSALALGISVPLWVFFLVMPIVQLVARFPISLNGIGITEGLLAFLFGRIGYSMTHAVLIGLLVEVVSAAATLPGMLLDIQTKKERKEKGDIPLFR
jgi:uncharacterized membrane protein YbhN (UPF0104 family)